MFSIPISKSPPHPRYTILESRFPLCNAILEGRPPLCNTCNFNVRIENDSGRKFSKTKISNVFLKQFKSKFFKYFLETTFVHVSCYPDQFETLSRKFCFGFRSPDLPFDIRFWTRGFLLVMRSRKAGFPFAVRARKREHCLQRYVSKMTLTENCKSQKFKIFFP